MFTFTEAQLAAWLSPIVWPFLRVLALFSVAPVFSLKSIPQRAKIGLAFFVALAAQGTLVNQPMISLNSPQALGAAVQQVGVGLSIGFAVRLVFTSVELAGELVGLQMGLNFATFFDPGSNSQVSAVSRFLGHMSMLLFVVMNGHLILLMAVIKSFDSFPLDGNFLEALTHIKMYALGSQLFSSALWMALPMIGMLLFVNLTMGVISRVAPQMNIYAIGFPVTLTMGLVGITVTLPMLDQPMMALMQRAIDLFAAQR
ncbi:flagellar biosynthetic protein FliR [Rhodoferax sp.]|uniref:flagellar biosynthetic protein FliR n=1 Tax=Rhodoferax sp. TaxID=50421 RepID=UPI00374D2A6B